MTMGVAKEQSVKGAALLEQASGHSTHPKMKAEEEVRRLQQENRRLRSIGSGRAQEKICTRCGRDFCKQGSKCSANGKTCYKCGNDNHLSKMCRSKQQDGRNRKPKKGKKKSSFGQLSSADESDSEEPSGRIVVGHLSSKSIAASIRVTGPKCTNEGQMVKLATDTGISKTLLNRNDWEMIKDDCVFVKTSKRFRPYGTAYHLPIKGKARVTLTAERGATVDTWAYVVDDKREQSLLGEGDAIGLGIVKLDLKGSMPETVQKLEYERMKPVSCSGIVSKGETQAEKIDAKMKQIIGEFPDLFTNTTGKEDHPSESRFAKMLLQ